MDSGLPSEEKKLVLFFFIKHHFFAIVHLYLVEDESPTTKTTDHNSHCKALHVTKSMQCLSNPTKLVKEIHLMIRKPSHAYGHGGNECDALPAGRDEPVGESHPRKTLYNEIVLMSLKKIVHNYYHLQSKVGEASAE